MDQRVQLKDGGMCGIVMDRADGKTYVKWGNVDRRDIVEWVEDDRLEAFPEPIFAGDPETRQKDKVYDPADNPWMPLT